MASFSALAPGGAFSLLRNLPFLAAHLVERVGYPLHDMERVHDPPRAVGGDDLDSAPLLSGELVEKQVQHVLAVLLVGPYQPSPVVVDNDNQVLVALLVGGLIDPDAPCTLEGLCRVRPSDRCRRAHTSPSVCHSTRASAATVLGTQHQARHPLLKVAREARFAPRPGH